MDTAQIRGVDSTHRETFIELEENAKLQVIEKLMTDGTQSAVTNMEVVMNGSDSSAQIISRSVAKGTSVQTFHPKAIAIPSSWIRLRYALFLKSMPGIWTQPLSMKQP